jgi:chromosome segregation ATPase
VDTETKQEFEALKALIVASVGETKLDLQAQISGLGTEISGLHTRMSGLETRISGLETRISGLETQISEMANEISATKVELASTKRDFEDLKLLTTNIADSVIREVGEVKETIARVSTRLDKIAAGAQYVTRLVHWSEKQDEFQLDILRRVQAIERRLDIRPEHQ